MKYMLVPLFFIAMLPGKAQDLDSLKQRILTLENNHKHIQLNLRKSHKEFGTGALITLAGAIMTTVYMYGREQESGPERPYLAYIGGGMSFIGACIMVDSHKHIGRAGLRIKNPPPK